MKSLFFILTLQLLLTAFCGCQPTEPWIKTTIQTCITKNEKIAGPSKGIKDYCHCMIPMVHDHFRDDADRVAQLQKGDIDFINEIKDTTFVEMLYACLKGEDVIYNPPNMENLLPERAKNSIRYDLMLNKDSIFQEQHDMKLYCDCYLEGLEKRFTYEQFMDKFIESTKKYQALIRECEARSLR